MAIPRPSNALIPPKIIPHQIPILLGHLAGDYRRRFRRPPRRRPRLHAFSPARQRGRRIIFARRSDPRIRWPPPPAIAPVRFGSPPALSIFGSVASSVGFLVVPAPPPIAESIPADESPNELLPATDPSTASSRWSCPNPRFESESIPPGPGGRADAADDSPFLDSVSSAGDRSAATFPAIEDAAVTLAGRAVSSADMSSSPPESPHPPSRGDRSG